jgi:hypothetical protein
VVGAAIEIGLTGAEVAEAAAAAGAAATGAVNAAATAGTVVAAAIGTWNGIRQTEDAISDALDTGCWQNAAFDAGNLLGVTGYIAATYGGDSHVGRFNPKYDPNVGYLQNLYNWAKTLPTFESGTVSGSLASLTLTTKQKK